MKYEESFTVELKQDINAEFKEENIDFANSDGGHIMLGLIKPAVSSAYRTWNKHWNRSGI